MNIQQSLDPARRTSKSRRLPIDRPGYRPTLERLETRLVLSTITWNGLGDGTNFGTAANWAGGKVPGASDDAVINVSSGVVIKLPAGGVALNSLTQAGGTLTATSGTTTTAAGLSLSGGLFKDNGGSISGPVILNSSTLHDVSTAGPASFTVEGNGALNGTIAATQTVQVEGGQDLDATLTLDPGAANLGTILLQPADGSYDRSNLAVAGGTTFTNTGTVRVAASITSAFLTGNFDNKGLVTVSAGATVYVGAAGQTFTQDAGGTINSPGQFLCEHGTLLIQGGTLSGDVQPQGCALRVASTLTTPATLFVVGTGTTLVSNDSPLATIQVEGESESDATLTLAPGAANLGTILLQSAQGSYAQSNLAVPSGSSFTNAGTIQVGVSINPSELTGAFLNKGTLDLAGSTLTLAGSGSALVNLAGGVIDASGTFDDSAGSFTNSGLLSIDTGAAAGLTIHGTYTQTSTGALAVELGGTTAVALYDQLNVTGAAVLAGSVNLSFLNSYSPMVGDAFEVLTFASASGMFASYNGSTAGNGLVLQPTRSTGGLTLTAAPEADLGVTVTPLAVQVILGGNATYQVTVTNLGPSDAQGVILTDSLPSGATVVSVSSTIGTPTTSGGKVTLNLATLSARASASVTIVVTPATTGTSIDTASVLDASPADSNPVNNSASSTVLVKVQGTLSLAASSSVSAYSRPLTLAAKVAVPPGFAPATGLVTFFDGTTSIGSAPLDGSGHASIVVSRLGIGSHALTASYSGDSIESALNSAATSVRVAAEVQGDFDGDGKTDFAIYDQTTATFTINKSAGGTIVQPFGDPTHINVPLFGDFDGDGKADIAIFDKTTATFYVVKSGGGTIVQAFGLPGHSNVPVVGDFDGDGKADVAIFDQTSAEFFIIKSSGGIIAQPFGGPGHSNVPIAGDFDGDGKTDLALYDQTAAEFFVIKSGGGVIAQPFGGPSHVNTPIAGDFDGDGKTDLALYDQTAAEYFVVKSGGGVIAQPFGVPTIPYIPLMGDFDGDGKTDIGVYDVPDAEFIVVESSGLGVVLPLGTKKHANIPS